MNSVIHAALRRDLDRFEGALASESSRSRDRADQLATAWQHYRNQLQHHHDGEENIYWPALRELGAGDPLMSELEGEHQVMLGALSEADAAMQAFAASHTAESASAARSSIAALGGALRSHLSHEERDLEPLAAANEKTPQLKKAARAVRRANPGAAGDFFAWLLDGADADTVALLRSIVPAPVLFVFSRIRGRGYTRSVATVWS